MWDLTVPGNNDHDFYVLPATTTADEQRQADVGTGEVPVLVHNDSCPSLIGVPQGAIDRVVARLSGLRVGDKSIVSSVEAFGSRAGSMFRGRGPLPNSDLDLLANIDPAVLNGRNGPWVYKTLQSIAADFESEAEFPLSLHAPQDGVGVFKQSIPGAQFVNLPLVPR